MALPILFSQGEQLVADPQYDPSAHDLKKQLSMQLLNSVHSWLAIAGSPGNTSSLHHQRVIQREIIPTESPALHLVWFDRIIYIKPLPDCLLNHAYHKSTVHKDAELHALAGGFLLSYTDLIQSPLDLAIAKELNLVPASITWKQWTTFCQAVQRNTTNGHINMRYTYGELRLSRLNIIWRLTFRGLTYFTTHREYSTYFNQYFALLITVFAFVAVVLSAMQVIVSTEPIDDILRVTCYRFAVAVLIGVCLVFVYIGTVFLLMFLYNVTLTAKKHRYKDRSTSTVPKVRK